MQSSGLLSVMSRSSDTVWTGLAVRVFCMGTGLEVSRASLPVSVCSVNVRDSLRSQAPTSWATCVLVVGGVGRSLHDSLSHLRSVMQVGVLLDHRLDLCSLHSGPSQIHGVFHRFVDLSVQSKLRYQPLSMWAEMFVSVTFS